MWPTTLPTPQGKRRFDMGAEIDTWAVVGLGSPKPRVSLT